MVNPRITLDELQQIYLTWLANEVTAGRAKDRTLRYYRTWIKRFVNAAGADRLIAELVPLDLERCKRGWHSVQAVQRLFNWGIDMGIIEKNPFRRITKPPLGKRQRTLTPQEMTRLLRTCRRPLRDFLMALRLTLARPQEIRQLRWSYYRDDLSAFLLNDFKAKARRKDSAPWRVLLVCPRLRRLLERIRRRSPKGDGFVFLMQSGRAWTSNALRLAVRRAAKRAGLDAEGQEKVVAYTLRHTAATNATRNGVRDRRLADILGHTSTKTTARYQHLQIEDLAEAHQQATQRKRRA